MRKDSKSNKGLFITSGIFMTGIYEESLPLLCAVLIHLTFTSTFDLLRFSFSFPASFFVLMLVRYLSLLSLHPFILLSFGSFNSSLKYYCLWNIISSQISKSCGLCFTSNTLFTSPIWCFYVSDFGFGYVPVTYFNLSHGWGVEGWETEGHREKKARKMAIKETYSKSC